MLKLLWAWATVSFSTHPECLKAPFTSIWSFETFTSSEFSQLMLQQLRQVYTKSCNYKTANNLDYVQTSRCVHIHYVQTRHCVHIHYVQTSTFFLQVFVTFFSCICWFLHSHLLPSQLQQSVWNCVGIWLMKVAVKFIFHCICINL